MHDTQGASKMQTVYEVRVQDLDNGGDLKVAVTWFDDNL